MAKVDKNKKETKKKKTFMKDFKAELKRVTWLTPKQLVNNTTAVIVIVLITALIVFVLDLTFKAVNTYGINRLKTAVETIHSDDEETITQEQENNEEQTSDEEESLTEETVNNEEVATDEQ